MANVQDLSRYVIVCACCAISPSSAVSENLSSKTTLFETPVIAAQPENTLVFGLNFAEDSRDIFFDFQALQRLRIGLSFPTFVEDDNTIAGNDLSVAYSIIQETTGLPAVGLGLTGIGSEGRGTGEYIVATKSFGSRMLLSRYTPLFNYYNTPYETQTTSTPDMDTNWTCKSKS